MCAVSMITGHYQQQYPRYQDFPSFEWPNYAELVRKAKLYDELTGQKDCPDPLKQAWHDQLEALYRAQGQSLK